MYIWIAAGGAIGSVLRFAVGGWVTTWAHGGFPWGTFAVNVLGTFALGVLVRTLSTAGPALSAFFITGVCGGFTTFSTFDYEMLMLLEHARYGTAARYAAASVATCLLGLLAGMRLGVHPPTVPAR